MDCRCRRRAPPCGRHRGGAARAFARRSRTAAGMASADMVRARAPARSIAVSSASAFITVASMPIMSPVTPWNSLLGNLHAAKDIAATDHDADGDPERLRRHQIGRDTFERGLVDAEALGPHQGFAGDLHDDASVDRLGHDPLGRCALAHALSGHATRTLSTAAARAGIARSQFGFIVAATSAAKSVSGRSMPSPSA